jgi:hypothetical protein
MLAPKVRHRRVLCAVTLVGCGALALGCGSSNASYRVYRPAHAVYVDCGRPFAHFDARHLLGLTVKAARSEAKSHGCQMRIVEEHGHLLPITDEYVSNRIDVSVDANHIVRIKFIG